MPKTLTFDVYSDPGHSWIKVHASFLEKIIGHYWRQNFTPFSHERGEWLYLEEDVDASRFVNCCRANGIEPKWREHHTDKRSRIRSYDVLSPVTKAPAPRFEKVQGLLNSLL
jgi:hypothetical protein